MNKVLAFVNEVHSELRKITWPSKDEMVGATIIVCMLVLFFAAVLGSMDFAFELVIRKFII